MTGADGSQDLELLASEDRDEALEDAGLRAPRSTPLQTSHQSDLHPPQFSRFFSCELLGLTTGAFIIMVLGLINK